VIVDEKARAFVQMSKTEQIRQPVLPCAFFGLNMTINMGSGYHYISKSYNIFSCVKIN
jgi:hypothetical protein